MALSSGRALIFLDSWSPRECSTSTIWGQSKPLERCGSIRGFGSFLNRPEAGRSFGRLSVARCWTPLTPWFQREWSGFRGLIGYSSWVIRIDGYSLSSEESLGTTLLLTT